MPSEEHRLNGQSTAWRGVTHGEGRSRAHGTSRLGTRRVGTEQRVFRKAGHLDLNPPLHWTTRGETTRSTIECR
ncbi:hypothetical protein ACFC1R_24690 [Kitasatospora sp. NPDC056138]|uniref:hypothetical protein n=1 Tax=Kitasatospora sp. NPDC056138 TaxID=3345724 RepID=UPI0035E14650